MITMKPHRLDALTSLRFFAAFAIVIHHAHGYLPFLKPIAVVAPLDMGVSFFFVLSGFVLFYNYPNDRIDKARFIVARCARIWPLHVMCLTAAVILLPYSWTYPVGPGAADVVATLFLLQAWVPLDRVVFAINGVSWSISVELFFYILFPFLTFYWAGHWPKYLFVSLVMVFVVTASSDLMGLPATTWGEDKLSGSLLGFAFPPVRLFEFVMGMASATVFRGLHKTGLQARVNCAIATLIEMGAVIFAILAVLYIPSALYTALTIQNMGAAPLKWVAQSGASPAFAMVLIVFAFSQGLISRMFAARPLVWLGEISFSMYMTHVILISYVANRGLFTYHNGPIMALAVFSLVVAVSAGSWYLIECPMRRVIVECFDKYRHRLSK